MIDLKVKEISSTYRPSKQAWEFHNSNHRFRYLVWGIKSGKCLAVTQKVLMADGTTKKAGDLAVGDKLMGMENSRGKPTVVTALEPTSKECYEIEFADGSIVRCSKDHRFPVYNYKLGRVQVWPLHRIIRKSNGKAKAKYKFIKPRNTEFGRSTLPIDPYFLGLLLGDGCIVKSVAFSTASKELLEEVTEHASEWGLETKWIGAYDYHLSSCGRRDKNGYNFNPLLRKLDEIGLKGCKSRTKFIPEIYKKSSLSDRLKLIAGLVDTDGHVYDKSRMIDYCTMSEQLAEGMQFLVRSVGGFCSIRRGHVGQYRLGITLNRELPTRVPYKKLAPISRDKTRIGLSGSKDIGVQDCIHISVSAENELFLLDNFVATHNTRAGAVEFVRGAMAKPNSLCWAVAPTYQHVQVMEADVMDVLAGTDMYNDIVRLRGQNQKRIVLPNGAVIQFKSCDAPDNLRGPNVDLLWIDEAAFLKEESWVILRGRIVARRAEVIFTTTPKGRTWFFGESLLAGMPADTPYGVFSEGNRWVSHFPTWDFPWVEKDEIEDARRSMTSVLFDQEFGAMFTASESQVFHYIQEAKSKIPIPKATPEATVIGLDLAKQQDFTATTCLDGNGHVRFTERWSKTDWDITKARVVQMCKDHNSVVVMDVSNVGSTIHEDLRKQITVHPIEMNSAQVQHDLVEALKLAFEQRRVKIIDPKIHWATIHDAQLEKELQIYEATLTRGSRISYGAPKGHHDDMVISLALAWWGRVRGLASAVDVSEVCLTREEIDALRPDKHDDEIAEIMGRRRSSLRRGATGESRIRSGGIFGNSGIGRIFGD